MMTASARVGWALLASTLGMLAFGQTASATAFDAHGSVGFKNAFDPTTTILDSYGLAPGPTVTTGTARFDNTAVLQTDQSIHLEADSFSSGPGQHAHSFSGWTHEIGTPDPDAFRTFLAQSGAHASFTDFVITGMTGSVLTSFNLHINGSLSVGSFFTPSLSSSASSQVQVALFGPGSGPGSNVGGGFLALRSDHGTPATGFGGGAFASLATAPSIASDGNVAFSINFSSAKFLAPVGVPFSVGLDLETSTSVFNDAIESFITSANADFASSLTFATDGPVFNLPAGFTVNSADAGIIDNTFSPSVPEPSTWLLLGSGLLALAWWKERTSRAFLNEYSARRAWPVHGASCLDSSRLDRMLLIGRYRERSLNSL
jgi:PEP-CTERM motif-containing protein